MYLAAQAPKEGQRDRDRKQHRVCTEWKLHPFRIQPQKSVCRLATTLRWLEQSQPH